MSRRSGFTLVELVVVVLILGILAAVAAPKIVNNSDKATDSSVAQTLATIRDAVELYRAENGGDVPGGSGTNAQADVKSALAKYLRGSAFPKCAVGNKNNNIKITNTGSTISVSGTEGWHFHSLTGEFIINSSCTMLTDSATKYSEL